jgi:hypothetical protein
MFIQRLYGSDRWDSYVSGKGSTIEKSNLFHTTSHEYDFYIKFFALDEIYNFLVLHFFHLRTVRCSNKIKFQYHINRVLSHATLKNHIFLV